MFKTEKEYGQAMLNGRVFDTNGNITKFDPDADISGYSEYETGGEYSPFVCKRKNRDYWEFMDELWYERQGIKEVFSQLPNLKVDTKVFVRNTTEKPWNSAHFKKWDDNGNMICFGESGTSFTVGNDSLIDSNSWKYWLVNDGEFKNRSNPKQ